jgi:hypothetical protein
MLPKIPIMAAPEIRAVPANMLINIHLLSLFIAVNPRKEHKISAVKATCTIDSRLTLITPYPP